MQLAAEAGVKRLRLTHQHTGLMQAFQAAVRQQRQESPLITPSAPRSRSLRLRPSPTPGGHTTAEPTQTTQRKPAAKAKGQFSTALTARISRSRQDERADSAESSCRPDTWPLPTGADLAEGGHARCAITHDWPGWQ